MEAETEEKVGEGRIQTWETMVVAGGLDINTRDRSLLILTPNF